MCMDFRKKISKNWGNGLRVVFMLVFFSILTAFGSVPAYAALAELYWPVRFENGEPNTYISSHNGEHRGIDIGNARGCSWYAPIDGVVERIYTGCVSNGYDTEGHTSCYPHKNGVYYGRTHMNATVGGVYYEGDYCNNGFGNGVVIQASIGGHNYFFQFAHMDSVNSELYPGQSIKKGTYLGKVGDKGFSFGTHAHFEVNKDRMFGEVVNNDPEQSGCQFTYSSSTNHDPYGYLDYAEGGYGTVRVCGWAIDDDTPDQAVQIHVYATDSAGVSTCINTEIIANNDSTDLGKHRFDVTFETTLRGHYTISCVAINTQQGNNPVMGITGGKPFEVDILERGEEMSTGNSRTIPDGNYLITSGMSRSMSLDIAGIDAPAPNGTNVELAQILSNGWINDNDAWNVTYEGNGFYRIKQMETSKYLDVYGGSQNNNANVDVWEESDNSSQKWAVYATESPSGYLLRAGCSGFWLTAENGSDDNGTNVIQSAVEGSNAQSWLFIPYKPSQPIEEGSYIIISCLDDHLELDIAGDSENVPDKTNVQVWNDSCDSRNNAIHIIPLDNGYYKFIQEVSGKAIEVYGGGSNAFGNISMWSDEGTLAQQWAITGYEDGYLIRSACSGYAMDVANYGTADGTNVAQYPFKGNRNQLWKFVKADYEVSFDANGGSNAPASMTKYYNSELTLTSAEPVRTGYRFLGWGTSGAAATVAYQPGDKYTTDEDIVLYAIWESMEPDIVLPESLTEIGTEAFMGCGFRFVKLSDNIVMIGNRAFTECGNLRYIYIPDKTISIAVDAFNGVENLTILGAENSYAELYAIKNGIAFEAYTEK